MKFFLSDLHIGCGDALEDFVFYEAETPPTDAAIEKSESEIAHGMERMHKAFSEFVDFALEKSGEGGSPPELIFLGDTFDLLQVLPEERTNPEKIDLIASAHKPFFKALTRFHKKGGDIVFVLGNHDHDLLYPLLLDALKKYLPFINSNADGKPLLYYHCPDAQIYAEHGNQFDTLNAFEHPADPEELPFGSELVLHLVNPFEATHPIIDNLGVREALWFALRNLPEILSMAQSKELLLAEAVAGLSSENRLRHVAYFLLHQIMPTSDSSIFALLWRLLVANESLLRKDSKNRRKRRGILYTFRSIGRNPLRIFQEFLTDRLADAAAKITVGKTALAIGKPRPVPRIVLFGHTHRARTKRLGGGRVYVNTGSWRMRAIPYGRFSLRLEQPLDYAIAHRTKRGTWSVRRSHWRDNLRTNAE